MWPQEMDFGMLVAYLSWPLLAICGKGLNRTGKGFCKFCWWSKDWSRKTGKSLALLRTQTNIIHWSDQVKVISWWTCIVSMTWKNMVAKVILSKDDSVTGANGKMKFILLARWACFRDLWVTKSSANANYCWQRLHCWGMTDKGLTGTLL